MICSALYFEKLILDTVSGINHRGTTEVVRELFPAEFVDELDVGSERKESQE